MYDREAVLESNLSTRVTIRPARPSDTGGIGGKMLRVFVSFKNLTPLGWIWSRYCGVTMLSTAMAGFQAAVPPLQRDHKPESI